MFNNIKSEMSEVPNKAQAVLVGPAAGDDDMDGEEQ